MSGKIYAANEGMALYGNYSGNLIFTYPRTGNYWHFINYGQVRYSRFCDEDIGPTYTKNTYCAKDPTDVPNEIPYNSFYVWKYVTTVQDVRADKLKNGPYFEWPSYKKTYWCVDGTHTLTYKLYYLCSKTDTTPPCGASCKAEIKNKPPLIRQCDDGWDDEIYDHPNYYEVLTGFYLPGYPATICNKGCALSSLNMLMRSVGCNQVDFLETNSCLTCFRESDSRVLWDVVLGKYCSTAGRLRELRDYVKKIVIKNEKGEIIDTIYKPIFKSVDEVLKETKVSEDIKNGYNYILHVKGSDKGCSHFVFLTGVSDDCKSFKVLDPSSNGTSETTITKICGYRKFK